MCVCFCLMLLLPKLPTNNSILFADNIFSFIFFFHISEAHLISKRRTIFSFTNGVLVNPTVVVTILVGSVHVALFLSSRLCVIIMDKPKMSSQAIGFTFLIIFIQCFSSCLIEWAHYAEKCHRLFRASLVFGHLKRCEIFIGHLLLSLRLMLVAGSYYRVHHFLVAFSRKEEGKRTRKMSSGHIVCTAKRYTRVPMCG